MRPKGELDEAQDSLQRRVYAKCSDKRSLKIKRKNLEDSQEDVLLSDRNYSDGLD